MDFGFSYGQFNKGTSVTEATLLLHTCHEAFIGHNRLHFVLLRFVILLKLGWGSILLCKMVRHKRKYNIHLIPEFLHLVRTRHIYLIYLIAIDFLTSHFPICNAFVLLVSYFVPLESHAKRFAALVALKIYFQISITPYNHTKLCHLLFVFVKI